MSADSRISTFQARAVLRAAAFLEEAGIDHPEYVGDTASQISSHSRHTAASRQSLTGSVLHRVNTQRGSGGYQSPRASSIADIDTFTDMQSRTIEAIAERTVSALRKDFEVMEANLMERVKAVEDEQRVLIGDVKDWRTELAELRRRMIHDASSSRGISPMPTTDIEKITKEYHRQTQNHGSKNGNYPSKMGTIQTGGG